MRRKAAKDDWQVEKLASLRLMLRVAQHRWSQNQSSGAGRETIDLMNEIDGLLKEVKPQEELQIRTTFVSGVVGRYVCQHCHIENRIEDGSYTPAEGPSRFAATPSEPTPVPAPSTAIATPVAPAPDNVVPLVDYTPTRQHNGGTYNPFGSEYHKGGY
jgi:hypothetical protein